MIYLVTFFHITSIHGTTNARKDMSYNYSIESVNEFTKTNVTTGNEWVISTLTSQFAWLCE